MKTSTVGRFKLRYWNPASAGKSVSTAQIGEKLCRNSIYAMDGDAPIP